MHRVLPSVAKPIRATRMIRIGTIILIVLGIASLLWAQGPTPSPRTGRPIQLIAFGDSLTAGTQDATTFEETQKQSWITLLAKQWNQIQNVTYQFPSMNLEGKRENESALPTNISIPGLELSEIFSITGPLEMIEGVPIDTQAYLLPMSKSHKMTPMEALKGVLQNGNKGMEQWVFVWLGLNDLLFDLTKVDQLTPESLNEYSTAPDDFEKQYRQMLQEITALNPDKIFLLTLPDYLRSGFFFNGEDFRFYLDQFGASVTNLPKGLVPFHVVVQLMILLKSGSDPNSFFEGLKENEVISLREQLLLRDRLKSYNESIRKIAKEFGVAVIPADTLFNELMAGVPIQGSDLVIHRGWSRGGLFSLDGLHPSNVGHAFIANAVIDFLNEKELLDIPPIDLMTVYNEDTYQDRDGDGFVAGPIWETPQGSIASLLRFFIDNDEKTN